MTDDQKAAWLKIFPLWPADLIAKFETAILIDFYRYGIGDPLGFQPWWSQSISPAAQGNYRKDNIALNSEQNFAFNLLNPTNAQYATTAKWDISFWYGTFLGAGSPQSAQLNMNQGSGGRINCNLHVSMGYDSRLYASNFQWNYAVIGDKVGSHTEQSWLWGSVTYDDYAPYLIVAPNASAQPYAAVDTVIAMHENGLDNAGVDYNLLYQYRDFRNAYEKFSGQIESNIAADKQKSAQATLDYKNSLADKLQAEKNSLQNLAFTTKQNIAAEAASANRDMTNTILSAQNLKLSLLQAIK